MTKNFSTLSSLILHKLIEQNTVNREVLYPIVQTAAFQSKSLDEMTQFIKAKLDEQKLNGDLSSLNWAQIRRNYIQNFEAVLKRSTEGESL